MNNRNLYKLLLLIALINLSCENAETKNLQQKNNSIESSKNEEFNQNKLGSLENDKNELTELVKQVFKWHINDDERDFPYKYDSLDTNIYIGIDWEKYDKRAESLKSTNFFSHTFLDNHRIIAVNIDSSMKKASKDWRNVMAGIPIWASNTDDWCGCQDNPGEDYWKLISINSLVVNNHNASFNWTWSKTDKKSGKKMEAEEVDGVWKIRWVEGFSYYGTVEDYDKIMN